jgi:hypothetical protein
VKVVAALIILAQLVMAQAVLAVDTSSLSDEAAFRHYAFEDGAPVDVNAMEQLMGSLPESPALYFVALAEDPPEGADVVARDILAALPGGTVVVVTPTDLGAVSADFSDAQLSSALDASIDAYDTSYVDGFRAFAGALIGEKPVKGGSDAGLIALVILVVLIVVVVVIVRRGKKSDEDIQKRRLTEARTEIGTQMDAVANRILELNDQVEVAANDEATAHYRAATDTYDSARDEFQKATTLEQLETLSGRLDHARWDLEAADALTEGRPVPPEPEARPAACFFDPTHRGGTEEATVTTPAGSKTVSVCHDCAERLRNGDRPTPRDIVVDGRAVPAPMAPRSHGGGGLDWMNVFQMVVAGMGTAAQYRRAGRLTAGRASTVRPVPSRSVHSPTGRARRSRR